MRKNLNIQNIKVIDQKIMKDIQGKSMKLIINQDIQEEVVLMKQIIENTQKKIMDMMQNIKKKNQKVNIYTQVLNMSKDILKKTIEQNIENTLKKDMEKNTQVYTEESMVMKILIGKEIHIMTM